MTKLITWTSQEAAKWGRLLTIAKEQAADPSRPAGDLGRAVDRCKGAVIPTRDEEGRAKVFMLWRFAQAFVDMGDEGRAANAKALGEHAEAAAVYIDSATGKVVALADRRPPPERPFRADIDG